MHPRISQNRNIPKLLPQGAQPGKCSSNDSNATPLELVILRPARTPTNTADPGCMALYSSSGRLWLWTSLARTVGTLRARQALGVAAQPRKLLPKRLSARRHARAMGVGVQQRGNASGSDVFGAPK